MARVPDTSPAAEPDAEQAGLPGPVVLAADERAALLDLARTALAVAVGAAPPGAIETAISRHAPVTRRAAAFVTLTEAGELRGCIGHLDAAAPVAASVVEAATWAALEDPRFARVRAAELSGIHLEVSVLGPLTRITDPLGWRPAVDGIVVERAGRRGLLLPEVAAMPGMDPEAMLSVACRKAGLPPAAWRDPGTDVYAFRTDRFGGPAIAEPQPGDRESVAS